MQLKPYSVVVVGDSPSPVGFKGRQFAITNSLIDAIPGARESQKGETVSFSPNSKYVKSCITGNDLITHLHSRSPSKPQQLLVVTNDIQLLDTRDALVQWQNADQKNRDFLLVLHQLGDANFKVDSKSHQHPDRLFEQRPKFALNATKSEKLLSIDDSTLGQTSIIWPKLFTYLNNMFQWEALPTAEESKE